MADGWGRIPEDGLEAAARLTHAERHAKAGADEIEVTGISGLLADGQHVLDAEVSAIVNALIATHVADYDLHPLMVHKTVDQTLIQNSTVLQDVTEMLFAVGANEVWQFTFVIIVNSYYIPDFKYAFAVPSEATIYLCTLGRGITPLLEFTSPIYMATAGINQYFSNYGLYIGGANAGNVQLQAAQYTAHASDTKVLAHSFIIAHKIA